MSGELSEHDLEFWLPSQPSRAEAIGVIAAMVCIVFFAAGGILAAVV